MSYVKPHAGVHPVTHHWEKITVTDLEFSSATRVENGTLLVENGELTTLLRSDPNIKDVSLAIARPGRMLYGHMGEDPHTETDQPTSSYPNPIPCND